MNFFATMSLSFSYWQEKAIAVGARPRPKTRPISVLSVPILQGRPILANRGYGFPYVNSFMIAGIKPE